MVTFENDYSFGACPEVLAALVDTNMEAMTGYGEDPHCAHAKELIRQACEAPDADVFLLAGGTQTNQVVLDMLLAPYEGVVAAANGGTLPAMRRGLSNLAVIRCRRFLGMRARCTPMSWNS